MNHSILTKVLCINGKCHKKTIINTNKNKSKCRTIFNRANKHKTKKHKILIPFFSNLPNMPKRRRSNNPLTPAQKRIRKRAATRKKKQQMSKISKKIKTLKKTLTKLKSKK